MTGRADLVARLERCVESCDLYSPDVCGTLIEGIGHVAMRALLREAASALRSSGEAVAFVERGTRRAHIVWIGDAESLIADGSKLYAGPGPHGPGSLEAVELTLCCGREECGGECGNPWRGMGWVAVRKAPATPTSVWRPKVEDFLRRLATMQPPNVVLQQITMLGEARDLLREAITPPTSTKA